MEEVLDHNQEAEQIFRQYGRLLELVAAAQLPGRPEDAEECVQDAVWAFVEGRAPWDPAQGSKQTWLCVLVRSRAKDRRRALAARMEEPLEEHSGLAAADHAERAAVRDGLRRVLEGLSREERRLFTLRFVYGLSSAELGTPEAAGGRGGLRGAGAGTDELPGRGRRGGGALPLFRRHRRHGG